MQVLLELVICGHSLGAGVAALLGLTWADPRTCMTVHSSGLPAGRRTSVFCFAPPCLTDGALSALANNLIVSLVYSNDVVSRLSLGSVRDIKNAALWLCEAEKNDESKYKKKDRIKKGEGYTVLTNRAKKWAAGQGYPEDPEWVSRIHLCFSSRMLI
jgi:sn1-specific diacylglycerol lipase